MNPVLDMTLSFEARGVVAYLLAAQHADTTVAAVRALGLGRDTAYRVCYELELRGIFRKSGKSSYNFLILGSSGLNFLNLESSTHELPNFLISGNQEDQQHTYRDSSDQNQRVVENTELPEIRKSGSQPELQQPLTGLPETPTPIAAPPPPPRKPRKENPPEARALYQAIFDICQSGPHGGLANGCRLIARNLWRDFQATPEQMAGYAEWRKTFSLEATIAAKERRPMRPARPKYIYEDWRQFLEWWDARQQDIARREQAEQRRREHPPEERATAELARALNPFRNRLSKPIPVATD